MLKLILVTKPIVVVQSLSRVQLFATPCAAEHQAPLSSTVSQSLFKFMSTESVIPSGNLILCHPSSSCLQSFPASGSFPASQLCIRWPKYWRFNSNPSNEYSGLISFRVDWFELLAVQETLKSLLQCHNLKASILWLSAFFTPSLTSIHKAQFCPLLAVCLWTTNVTHLSSGK